MYRLLFDLTADDLERYQNHIDFNIGLVDVDSVLEVKLRENIVTNLTVAQVSRRVCPLGALVIRL